MFSTTERQKPYARGPTWSTGRSHMPAWCWLAAHSLTGGYVTKTYQWVNLHPLMSQKDTQKFSKRRGGHKEKKWKSWGFVICSSPSRGGEGCLIGNCPWTVRSWPARVKLNICLAVAALYPLKGSGDLEETGSQSLLQMEVGSSRLN